MKIKPGIKKNPVAVDGIPGHRLKTRTRCRYCGRSFNKAKAAAQGHVYSEEHLDYFSEAEAAYSQCRQCTEEQGEYYCKLGVAMEAKMFMERFENDR